MNCAVFKDLVAAFIDGDVTSTERLAVEQHLKGCEACRVMCAESSSIRDTVRRHRVMEPIPDGLMNRVWHALDKWTAARIRMRSLIFASVGFAAVVALAGITVSNLPKHHDTIQIAQTVQLPPQIHVTFSENTSNTSQAFAMVRQRMGTEVPPVALALVGGRLNNVTIYDQPALGMLTYRLHGGLLRFYISRTPFDVHDGETWSILNHDVTAAHSPTGLIATWVANGLNYAVVTDYDAPQPKLLLAEFLRALGPGG